MMFWRIASILIMCKLNTYIVTPIVQNDEAISFLRDQAIGSMIAQARFFHWKQTTFGETIENNFKKWNIV
jgi:hypothetical protein